MIFHAYLSEVTKVKQKIILVYNW